MFVVSRYQSLRLSLRLRLRKVKVNVKCYAFKSNLVKRILAKTVIMIKAKACKFLYASD